MKVSSAWIKECLRRTMLSDADVVQALERAGIEVEQVTSSKPIDKRVVVALVKKVVQHPGADRLRLVEVEIGERNYNIVCGAPNVREGLKVALAQIGSVLPSGDKIEKAKLRGEVSEGMLCSEFELDLGQDHNGIMELSSELTVGTSLCDIYPSDSVIDLKTPANRWDVQNTTGLAREVAAMTDTMLNEPAPPPVKFSSANTLVTPAVSARRYTLAKISVNQASPSPSWLVARLRAAGVRSIGPVVDVTNYVMLELGQPLHAFDASKVTLPVTVRAAKAGETLTTLDGVARKLSTSDLVIADAKTPIALAGLMGGKATEVTPDTTDILLESAVFDAVTIRKMAQRHGLRTEASGRMERSIPTALPPLGLARAVQLLGEVAAATLEAAEDVQTEQTQPWNIALSSDRLSQTLGFGITPKEAVAALSRLGIKATPGATISVPEVPWWRPDVKAAEDLVEEIVRVVGYDKVPSTIPSWRPARIEFDRQRAVRRMVRDIGWAAGAFEVMTYSFVSEDQLASLKLDPKAHLKLKNPLSTEQAYLRSTLLPSHLATLERNRMYAKSMKFFEISKVFHKRGPAEQPNEPLMLAITVLEPSAAYASAKGLLDAISTELGLEVSVRPAELPAYASGRAGEVLLGGDVVGSIGQLHPSRIKALKLDGEAAFMEVELTPLMAASGIRPYTPPSPYPGMLRDVALLVPTDVTWQAVRSAAATWSPQFVSDYYGQELPEGMKSITIRLKLTLPDRTPTEAEAAELEQAVVARLGRKLGAKRRD